MWKRFTCRCGSVHYFPICQGTLLSQTNNFAVMKANWYYVHSLHIRQMVARFVLLYLLEDDTAAPSELYARLYHEFPVYFLFLFFFFFNDFSENNYLRICWTDFPNIFTEWKHFRYILLIWTSFLDMSRVNAMATNFVKKWQTPHFRCSGIQKWNWISFIINSVNDAFIWLYRVKISWTSVQ